MLRTLFAVSLFSVAAVAQSQLPPGLSIDAPKRVAPPHLGAAFVNESVVKVEPHGDGFAVYSTRNVTESRVTLFDHNGVPLAPPLASLGVQPPPAAAQVSTLCDASGCLALKLHGNELVITRYDEISGTATFTTRLPSANVTADFDGTNYVFAYLAHDNATGYAVKLSPAGVMTDPKAIGRIGPSGAPAVAALRLVRLQDRHVLFSNISQLYGHFYRYDTPNTAVIVLDYDLQPVGGQQVLDARFYVDFPSFAVNGDTLLAAWEPSMYNLGVTPFTATVTRDGVVSAPRPLVIGENTPTDQTIASGRDTDLVTWIELSVETLSYVRFAQRLTKSGERIGDQISFGAPVPWLGGTPHLGRATAIGDDFLIVWMDSGEARGAILRGGLQTLEPVDLGDVYASAVAAVSNGTTWTIVCARGDGLVQLRVAASGLVLTPVPVRISSERWLDPHAASDGDRVLISGGELLSLLDRDGNAIGTPQRIASTEARVAIAADGAGFAVAYAVNGALRVQRVNAAGTLPERFAASPAGVDTRVQFARLGTGWLLMWSDTAGTHAARTDRAATQVVDAPFSLERGAQLGANDDGSVTELFLASSTLMTRHITAPVTHHRAMGH